MTMYRAESPPTPVDAQTVIDGHPLEAATGRCRRCGIEDCWLRAVALRTLAAHGRLPRRSPGATRPELIGPRTPAGYRRVTVR